MPREKLFNEESQSISIRVPKSKANDYRKAIRKFVEQKYNKELDTE